MIEIQESVVQEILSLRVFGSVARADSDVNSDLDVLAVLPTDRPLSSDMKCTVEKLFDQGASISWYSQRRIEEMFDEGHLFAWHLFNESLPLVPDFIDLLGPPRNYEDAIADVESLIEILIPIPRQLENCSRNAVYEAGLLFLCMRNIALSASWFSATGLDFTRRSPFNIQETLDISFPIAREEYDGLINCRLSGQRGLVSPKISSKDVCELQSRGLRWASEVKRFIGGQLNNENRR
jgi:predicted nucleotidyltransferase